MVCWLSTTRSWQLTKETTTICEILYVNILWLVIVRILIYYLADKIILHIASYFTVFYRITILQYLLQVYRLRSSTRGNGQISILVRWSVLSLTHHSWRFKMISQPQLEYHKAKGIWCFFFLFGGLNLFILQISHPVWLLLHEEFYNEVRFHFPAKQVVLRAASVWKPGGVNVLW